MRRKSLTFFAVLALTTTLSSIRTSAQQRGALPNAAANQPSSSQSQPTQGRNQDQPAANQNGAAGASVVVTVNQPAAQTSQSEPRHQTPNGNQGGNGLTNWLTVILTAVIAGVGALQWRAIKRQANIMAGQLTAIQGEVTATEKAVKAAQDNASAALDTLGTIYLTQG